VSSGAKMEMENCFPLKCVLGETPKQKKVNENGYESCLQ